MQDPQSGATARVELPANRGLFYGGAWHEPNGGYVENFSPSTGESLGNIAHANTEDVAAAVAAAHDAFGRWSSLPPRIRGNALRDVAAILRKNKEQLALLDAVDCGNPVQALLRDIDIAAELVEYFAGLVYELRGSTIPMGDGVVNMTMREPFGVCARIVAYNHPIMFTASRFAAPVAAGNSVIMKPPVQAPLSSYRLAELIDGVFPPGIFNVLSGDRACGEALVQHPDVPRVTLIGSVPTGRAISGAAAEGLKHVSLELGGKNALVIYPDADIDRAIEGAVRGMAFTWCGQACSSTTRLFLHEDIYDQVLQGVLERISAFRPGDPTDPQTTMGAIVSKQQFEKILGYIDVGKNEGATLAAGGAPPPDNDLADGYFIEPTVFTDVSMDMQIAKEEIFGPVLSVFRWSDEDSMFDDVNSVEYGLAAGVFTQDLRTAHRAASRFQAGYVWVNNACAHFFPAPFGGFKQSGNNKEESFEELLSYTQLKNVYIEL